MDKIAKFSSLAASLPELIPAKELPRLLGDVYSRKYFNNLRWMNKGPRHFKLGHKVIHLKEDVLAWLEETAKEIDPDIAA